jgi:hypothetical protein
MRKMGGRRDEKANKYMEMESREHEARRYGSKRRRMGRKDNEG